tara:strand:+ start:57 stop:785 length:729 start_codon:yes stop_codon:yes gene_type:complete
MASSFSPKIVTDGLVYAIDMADQNSYQHLSTTVSDLATNKEDATIHNVGSIGDAYIENDRKGLSFDGTNDLLLAGEDTQFLCQSTQDATISWWGYIDGSHSGAARMVVIHKTDGFSRFGIGWGHTDTKFFASYNQSDTHSRLQSTNNFAVGNWYNTVATKQGATVKLFINNVLEGTATDQTQSDIDLSTAANTTIMYNNYPTDLGGQEFLQGVFACCHLYDRALTVEEINQNFNAQRSRFGL